MRADLDIPISNFKFPHPPSNCRRQVGQAISNLGTEATRLTNLKPTVDYLLEHGVSRIIIAGHIDRPKGSDPELSTKKLLQVLEKILGQKIVFSSQFTVDPSTSLRAGSSQLTEKIVLLENLRFWPGEEASDLEFAKKLAGMAQVYVNEAFGNSHRNHASMVLLPSLLPHAAGLHLEKEVEVLSSLLKNPERPFVAIVGGAKIETKVPVIENLAKIADFVLVGGAIAKEFPNSPASPRLRRASNFQIPNSNVIVATSEAEDKDIDQKSIDKFREVIATAKTVVWNGPMGVFEEGFDKGTKTVAQAIIQSGAYSVVGGGETTEFLAQNNLLSPPNPPTGGGGFSFVSSGGGVMLEFLAGHQLPGIKALE